MNEKLLSVVIPLTQMAGRMENLESWFSEAADLPLEIIIVHDIQDLFTGIELIELVKDYEKLDIKVVEGNFNSPGLARNAGLNDPRAPWVAFWDADDLPSPSQALAAIAETDSDTEVIIANYTIHSRQGVTSVNHNNRIEAVAVSPGLWRMIIKRSILGETKFNSVRMGEDQLFLIDLNLGSRTLRFCEREIYQYFQGSPLQLTSNQESINEIEKTFILARDRIRNKPKLRTEFSEIVLLRLLGTSFLRSTRTNRFIFLVQNVATILRLRPKTIVSFAVHARKRG